MSQDAFQLDLYGANGRFAMRLPIQASTNDFAVGTTTNTTVALTYNADTSRKNELSQVVWSYSGTPTGGGLKVEDGSGNAVRGWDIAVSGPGSVVFDPPIIGGVNSQLIVTLLPGGSGVTGKINATVWKLL